MIGVALRDIGPSELLSEVSIHNTDGICYFIENSAKPVIPLSKPVLHICDAFTFRGPLVATNLSTAAKLLNMPCIGGRFFYPWNLEWLNNRVNYNDLWPYYSDRITIFARCHDHKIVLENCFNIKVDVMNSLSEIYELLKDRSNKTFSSYTFNGEKQIR